MIVSGIGSYNITDGTIVIYDENGVMHEMKIPFCIIGNEIKQDKDGLWHVIPDGINDKMDHKITQADKFYYKTRDFLNYRDYLYIVDKFPSCYDKFVANPYFLCEVYKEDEEYPIISFKDLDSNICLDTFEKRKLEIRAVSLYLLRNNEALGNTWMYYKELENKVNNILSLTGHPLIVSKDIKPYLLNYPNDFHIDKKNGSLRVSFYYTYTYERTIGNMVRTLINEKTPFPLWNPVIDEKLVDEQKDAVINNILKGGKISVITGGPGTGKTTILRSIVENMQRQYPDVKMAMLSTTGKAAKVMSKVFGDLGVHISTVHKFLGYGHPLSSEEIEKIREVSFIVIDEASMLNLEIFSRLIKFTDFSKCKIILVGDIDQLPAIGAGNILADIIDIGAYVSILRENHRSSKGIIQNAGKIRDGELFLTEDDTFEIKTVPECISPYLVCHAEDLNNNERIVISPYKKHGFPGSTSEMNSLIHQEIFDANTNDFCKGDRIIIIKTNYKQGYFNGEPGIITGIRPDKSYIVNLYDRVVVVKDPKDLSLGYAITVHKSQGSEYNICDICIPEYSTFITRRMLYTAVTRAKYKVRLWTNKEIIRKIIMNNPDVERKTFLCEC